MAFNTLTVWCECYLYVVLKQFITRKEDLVPTGHHPPSAHSLPRLPGSWKFPVWICLYTQLLKSYPAFYGVAHQAPLSVGFSRREQWNGSSCPPPGGLPNPGIEIVSPASAGRFFATEPPGKPVCLYKCTYFRCFIQTESYDMWPFVSGFFHVT